MEGLSSFCSLRLYMYIFIYLYMYCTIYIYFIAHGTLKYVSLFKEEYIIYIMLLHRIFIHSENILYDLLIYIYIYFVELTLDLIRFLYTINYYNK